MNHGNTPTNLLVLIITNCIPLIGIFVFGWDVVQLIWLYWLETVVIGIFAILRILRAKRELFYRLRISRTFVWNFFFLLYIYGIFLAVFTLPARTSSSPFFYLGDIPLGDQVFFLVLTLVGMHLVSFVGDIAQRTHGESLKKIYLKPFSRAIVMHMAILCVGFVVSFFGLQTSLVLAVLLVLMKLLADLLGYYKINDWLIERGARIKIGGMDVSMLDD